MGQILPPTDLGRSFARKWPIFFFGKSSSTFLKLLFCIFLINILNSSKKQCEVLTLKFYCYI